jgi:hypothetical protein
LYERIVLALALLRTANSDEFSLPVNIFKTKISDFSAAKAINREQE